MLSRRSFIGGLALLPLVARFARGADAFAGMIAPDVLSDFSKHLHPVGRILELEGFYVWCNAPIEGPDGRTHVFFSRWPAAKGMGGWINASEIAHAVASNRASS